MWLQYRLTAIGLNPINNIVDMTNFVMAELAQPMHAFDADLLHGDTIFVRPAHPGEHFARSTTNRTRSIPRNLVIADAAGAIALAGVIGGGDSAISAKTTRVVLESANFQAASIRKTSSAIKLRTDASMRFEKAQDPANTVRGLARAIELLQELSPGIRLVGGLADQKREIPAPPPIELPLAGWSGNSAGPIEPPRCAAFWRAWSSALPSRSPACLLGLRALLARHQGRLHQGRSGGGGRPHGGLRFHPAASAAGAGAVPPGNPERRFQHEVRNIFVDQGFTEVYNYSFLSEEAAQGLRLGPRGARPRGQPDRLRPGADAHVAAAGHLAATCSRTPSTASAFRLFEIGLEIHRNAARPLPDEIPHLVAAMYDRHSGDDGDAPACSN